ncbi:MAG: response regulator [Methanomicrobiaceae archaeon]|nr:response regulator [Methanomicrobiaceae archaeon]
MAADLVHGSDKKILIVEDEAIFAMSLRQTLENLGYTVVGVAMRGTDALRIARETWPDCIIMDIRLQGPMDGIETAEKINAVYDIPVIFLTAYSDDDTIYRAILSRSYGFLIKPINERELYTNIEIAIHAHTARKKSQIEKKINESAFYLVSDAILTTDVEGSIKRINRAAEEMCGWREEEILGERIWDLFAVRSDEIRAFMDAVHHERGPGSPMACRWPDRVSITTKDGEQIAISVAVDLVRADDQSLSELVFVFSR